MRDNQKAKATITAIIDGTGSLGAALGPLVTGFVSDKFVSHTLYHWSLWIHDFIHRDGIVPSMFWWLGSCFISSLVHNNTDADKAGCGWDKVFL